jgi:hypothetical protein
VKILKEREYEGKKMATNAKLIRILEHVPPHHGGGAVRILML